MAGIELGRDRDEAHRQLFDGKAFEILGRLPSRSPEISPEPTCTSSSARTRAGGAAGEFGDLAQLARRVTAPTTAPIELPRQDVGTNSGLIERLQHPDMRPAARRASPERQAELDALLLARPQIRRKRFHMLGRIGDERRGGGLKSGTTFTFLER